ncbi:hypothetical protein ACGF0J_07020 [Nonomuraea sp. NPDC047897]|uniref:hypothetical protein n=1 Tax=Nonomuraea sp. NPDC047897 TaxID=3364346 RepID=UPI0037193777
MSGTNIHGTVADGFERVREAFAEVVAEQDSQTGSQLAAYAHGRQVVDAFTDPLNGIRFRLVLPGTRPARRRRARRDHLLRTSHQIGGAVGLAAVLTAVLLPRCGGAPQHAQPTPETLGGTLR